VDWFESLGNATFSLDAENGDSIFLYCLQDDGTTIEHISAITNTGVWGNSTSLLPESLPDDAFTTLNATYPNYEYDGDTVGTATEVRSELGNASYWEGHADYIPNLQTQSSFKIVNEPKESNADTWSLSFTSLGIMVLTCLLLFV